MNVLLVLYPEPLRKSHVWSLAFGDDKPGPIKSPNCARWCLVQLLLSSIQVGDV
jgi:hypothetical protein